MHSLLEMPDKKLFWLGQKSPTMTIKVADHNAIFISELLNIVRRKKKVLHYFT